MLCARHQASAVGSMSTAHARLPSRRRTNSQASAAAAQKSRAGAAGSAVPSPVDLVHEVDLRVDRLDRRLVQANRSRTTRARPAAPIRPGRRPSLDQHSVHASPASPAAADRACERAAAL